MTLLPGRFSGPEEFEASFWLMDFAGMDRVMKTYFDVSPPEGYEQALEDNPNEDYWLRIDIQNSTGNSNAAYSMADYLQSIGYSNVHIDDDWPQKIKKTQVIPQWGNVEAGTRLQRLVAKSDLSIDSTGKLQSDLTIRLGTDWLKSRQAKEFILPFREENPNPRDEQSSNGGEWQSETPSLEDNWSNQIEAGRESF